MNSHAIIWTEGKTDWQHLKRAFSALGFSRGIAFNEFEDDFGDDQLLKQCIALARVEQPTPTIFVFDRDNDEIVRRVTEEGQAYKAWGNNVFSFAIPTPAHRNEKSGICIELYYTDDELKTLDSSGRRLFLSNEFNPTSRRHLVLPNLNLGNKAKVSSKESHDRVLIIDTDVFDEKSKSIALSKADFATNVLGSEGSFGQFNFEPFRSIAELIDTIIQISGEAIDLPFGDSKEFFDTLQKLDNTQQFAVIVKAAIRSSKLAAMTFIAAALRHYEQRIVDESSADAKKVRPIKQILAQSFGNPALATVQKLARHCSFLIDENAPAEICTLRAMMEANPVLGPIGDLLDDLEKVFGAPRVRIVGKRERKKPILDYLLPELARYEGRMGELPELRSAEFLRNADSAVWIAALATLQDYFSPLRSLSFRVRTIERVRSDSDEFDVLLTTYKNQVASVEELTQRYQDLDDSRLETYELLTMGDDGETALDISPFIVVRNNKLEYYNRTGAHGYEYNVVFGSAGRPVQTKRKFSHAALRTTIAPDKQNLFWTYVTPSISSLDVKTNYPSQERIVGRKEQIDTIMEELIQIPNQNGIIHGPGGVGKTALLIELSRQLSEEGSPESVPFKNIIWVSAKADYYDPTLDTVEAGQPQFRSLDNVLGAILEFLEWEDASKYNFDDKKWLVLECLRDERTLLILDNFESVAPAGQQEILKFFGVTAKQHLKDKPDFFKVLVTSRELIASGFHQINLTGLDPDESRQLMLKLYEPYAHSRKKQRSDQEIRAIHDATLGIPLLIKHCYGQIYEYNRELDHIVAGLSKAGSKVVNFSFKEVFDLLKQDELHLRTILLLEVSGRRLMSRQIAEILGADEAEITQRLSQLVSLQCLTMTSTAVGEKYGVNDEVRFLTRTLTLEHSELATNIKRQIAGLAIEKRMDYTSAESDALLMFDDYISQGHYVLAENFIMEQLEKHPDSLLLNMNYARYLKEIRGRTEDAISRLQEILKPSGYDQHVLRLLMNYYIALEIPNYEQAQIYARELEELAEISRESRAELAEFYVSWSTALKMKKDFDPIREMERQQKYKELADKAVKLLRDVSLDEHECHRLLAQSYYNLWDYDRALLHIDKAIAGLPPGSHLHAPYRRLKREILKHERRYAHRLSA